MPSDGIDAIANTPARPTATEPMAPSGKRPTKFRRILLASLVALGLALPGLLLVQRSRSANRAAICARWTELSLN